MPENTTPRPSRSGPRPNDPFVFDVREVGRRPGSVKEYRRRVPAPAGLGLDIVGVPEGAPLALDVRLESVTEGVLVTGTVTAPLTGECGRCLEGFTDEAVVDVCELFAYPNSVTDQTTEKDEILRIGGDYLDVEPVVRDSVVLSLPWTPLCRDDCRGLCPDCGQRLDDLPPDHTHEQLDPRWAALAAFSERDPAPGAPDSPTHSPTAQTTQE